MIELGNFRDSNSVVEWKKTILCQAKGEVEDRSLWQYLPVNFALWRHSSVRAVQ
jgi:hypothetical protein